MEFRRIICHKWKQIMCIVIVIYGICLFDVQNDSDEKIYFYYNEMLQEFRTTAVGGNDYSSVLNDVYKVYNKGIKSNPDREYIEKAEVLLGEKIRYIYTYNDKLKEDMERAKEILEYSLFQEENSYGRLSIIKSAGDMEALMSIQVEPVNTMAVERMLSYSEIPILFVGIILVLVVAFKEEESNGMRQIVRSCREGRGVLSITRCMTLLITSLIMSVVINLSIWGIYLWKYGGISGIGACIQSSQAMMRFPLDMTIGQFVVWYCMIFALGMFAVGMLAYLIMIIIKEYKIGCVTIIGILVIEYILYKKIPDNSNFCILKYINLFTLILRGETVKYHNWGMDGWVTDVATSTMLINAAVILICFVGIVVLYSRKYISENSGWITGICQYVSVAVQRGIGRLNLIGYEIYKLVIIQKGWLIFALFIYLLSGLELHRGVDYNKTNNYIIGFYEEFQGEFPGPKAYGYVENLKRQYQDIEDMMNTTGVSDITKDNLNEAINHISSNLEYLENIYKTRNIEVRIVNPMLYDDVLGERTASNWERINVYSILTIIFIVAWIFAYDRKNGVIKLQRTSVARMKIWYCKLWIAVGVCTVVWLVSGWYGWHDILSVYKLNCLDAPIQSLASYGKVPFGNSILQYIMLVQALRLLILMAIGILVFCISVYHNYLSALVVSMLMLVPHLLYVFKVPYMERFSVVLMTDMNRQIRLMQIDITRILTIVILIVVVMMLCGYTYVNWKKREVSL